MLCPSALRRRGTGLGVRAVYQSKAREAGQRGLYLRPRPFYGRVQVHRIRPANTVPGAKVIRNTRPAASHRSFGRKDCFRLVRLVRPDVREQHLRPFSMGPGMLNNN